MSKLIEKEGKFYKECGVVMLEATNGSSHILINPSNGVLYYHEQSCDIGAHRLQHLYITSDDEIKEGDKVLIFNNEGNIKIFSPKICSTVAKSMNLSNKDSDPTQHKYKKIIATTDTSLYINAIFEQDMHMYQKGLPQPSDKFIQAYIDAYNKGEKIEKVLVELEMYAEDITNFINYKPKLKDNNIIIKKVKDSWSRAEVETSHLSMAVDIAKHILEGNSFTTFNPEKWIEENI